MRARPHYQAGRKDSHALKLYRYAARPHVQVDTDRAWSRIKFSQYESRLALWKLTLKFQPRRSIWNGLPGPIRTTFGRSLRLAEFFWFDLHTMCIQCALPILGWCEAPFLDMGTCKVQGPKRFKLETLAWDYVQKVSKSKWRDGFWRFAWTLWSHGTIPDDSSVAQSNTIHVYGIATGNRKTTGFQALQCFASLFHHKSSSILSISQPPEGLQSRLGAGPSADGVARYWAIEGTMARLHAGTWTESHSFLAQGCPVFLGLDSHDRIYTMCNVY